MTKFTSYPKYKLSGLDCFGEIPEDWKVIPIKFSLDMPITDGPHSTPTFYPEGVPFLSAESVKNDRLDFDRKRGYISVEDHEIFSKKYRPKFGDVYMVKSGATTGAVARVHTHDEFNIWSPLAVLRPHAEKASSDFIFFVLKSKPFFYSVEQSWSYGTQQNIGMGVISNIRMAFPPLDEQQAIARFLDFKTAQIDALIAKKQTLLDKLAEKRAALISHAVTKGLDPSVPMKDSGVAWLGNIPAHWVCPPLYSRYTIELGKMLNESRISGNYLIPYLRNIDVQWDAINTQDLPVMDIRPDEYFRYLVCAGDLLVCEGGEVGRAAIIGDDVGLLGFQKALHRLRCVDEEKEKPRFMFYTLCWAAKSGLFLAEGNPNTIPHLTGEKLRRYRFPCPPIIEQQMIPDWLDEQCDSILKQQIKISQVIDTLNEYRSALITNAVTGKIDVREWHE